jgi:hypothetical protein
MMFNCPQHGLSYGACCPRCLQPLYSVLGYYQAPVRGCICPPTSEQTCQAPMCPRKPLKFGASGMSAGAAETAQQAQGDSPPARPEGDAHTQSPSGDR